MCVAMTSLLPWPALKSFYFSCALFGWRDSMSITDLIYSPGRLWFPSMLYPALHHYELTGKLDCCVLSWQLIAASCRGSGEQRAVWKGDLLIGEAVHPPLMGCTSHETWHLCTVLPTFSHTCPRGPAHCNTSPFVFCKCRAKVTQRVNNRTECAWIRRRLCRSFHVVGEYSCKVF